MQERQIQRLDRVRGERDDEAVAGALDRLHGAASDARINLMPPILEAVRAYATLGEIIAVMKEIFGKYEEPTWI